jgi:hypothetical protein
VLERATGDDHFGLVVLLRQGVAAWMVHASTLPTVSQGDANDRAPVAPLLLDELRSDIVRVLTSMVMTTRQDRCA